jgi:hypothetical protein
MRKLYFSLVAIFKTLQERVKFVHDQNVVALEDETDHKSLSPKIVAEPLLDRVHRLEYNIERTQGAILHPSL